MWPWIGVAVVVLVFLCARYPDAMFGTNRHKRRPVGQANPTAGKGFHKQIVGESHYQTALRAIAGPGEVRHLCQAVVAIENGNAYDPMAVVITIYGRKVGYLARASARKWRVHHADPVTCEAVIVGGGRDRDLGVWLKL
jgi:hypothetical protein